jgi:hypothetical protein
VASGRAVRAAILLSLVLTLVGGEAWAQSRTDRLVDMASRFPLDGQTLGQALASYPYANGLAWRLTDTPAGRTLVEADVKLDTRKLVGEQSLRGMIPPKAASDILDGIDRMDLLVTFVAAPEGTVSLNSLSLYAHCAKGRFKTYPLSKAALAALSTGEPLPWVVLEYADKELFICEDW